MRELALFAGAGGGILGGVLLGWRTVCAVEINAFCARRLMQRQNEGHLPPFPIWDDVCSFDGRPWRGAVDVVSGGFPCQDISIAGKRAGIHGERSGLWFHMARVIRDVGPRFVFVENSPNLARAGLDVVLSNLASMGYDAQWGVLGADNAGAPHSRKRIWIVAHSDSEQELQSQRGEQKQWERSSYGSQMGDSAEQRLQGLPWENSLRKRRISVKSPASSWWATEPQLGRMAHGVAYRVDRLKAIGNGQVPAVVAGAWEVLHDD